MYLVIFFYCNINDTWKRWSEVFFIWKRRIYNWISKEIFEISKIFIQSYYKPTAEKGIVENMKEYRERLKSVRRTSKTPDELDYLKFSDDKYIILEFDPTVEGDNSQIYNKRYWILLWYFGNIIPLLNWMNKILILFLTQNI